MASFIVVLVFLAIYTYAVGASSDAPLFRALGACCCVPNAFQKVRVAQCVSFVSSRSHFTLIYPPFHPGGGALWPALLCGAA